MQVQVHTDNNISAQNDLAGRIEGLVQSSLERFSDKITTVVVHFTDENSSAKSGSNDKRCAIEARIAGMQPVAVTHTSESVDLAFEGATDKLTRLVDSTLGRRDRRH